jgi:CDP-diglyceride synthetase
MGDLTGAFLKRRLNIPPGGLLPVVDQIDFIVGAILFSLLVSMPLNFAWHRCPIRAAPAESRQPKDPDRVASNGGLPVRRTHNPGCR